MTRVMRSVEQVAQAGLALPSADQQADSSAPFQTSARLRLLRDDVPLPNSLRRGMLDLADSAAACSEGTLGGPQGLAPQSGHDALRDENEGGRHRLIEADTVVLAAADSCAAKRRPAAESRTRGRGRGECHRASDVER